MVPGRFSGAMAIRMSRKDFLVIGSFWSFIRLVEISLVTAEARPAFKAAWRAKHEANLVLLFMEVTELIVGTSLILVPSGKCLEVEVYQRVSLS